MQCAKLKTYMETGRVVFLPARSIRPNPAQPRKIFEPEALSELSESIKSHGIIQPLSVRRVGNTYELIAGERRLRAGQMAGLTEIPCIVMNMDDQESTLVALVEKLIALQNLSQEQAAKLLGKSQSAVANKLRLLRHSPQVLQALRDGGLTERHARALLRLETEPEKLSAIAVIVRQAMSVAKTEAYIESLLQTDARQHQRKVNVGHFINSLTQSLSKIQSAGIAVVSQRLETEREIQLTITIPK